jgi:biotin-(acetyl-CoA carboxylase) ligase
VTLNQKVNIYKKLVAGLGQGVKLAAVLDRLGETAERKKVERKNEVLAQLASTLRKGIQKSWDLQAKEILKNIKAHSVSLEAKIKSIEKTKKAGEKVVKALGYIDKLIDIAKTVAKAMA